MRPRGRVLHWFFLDPISVGALALRLVLRLGSSFSLCDATFRRAHAGKLRMDCYSKPKRRPPVSSNMCFDREVSALNQPRGKLEIHPRKSFGFALIFRSMLGSYRSRSILALSLMVAQAFLFNAVFFSFGLLLTKFSGVTERQVGIYLIPLTTSNFCGPLLLGLLFDTVGRRKMIAGTYATAGLILIIAAVAFGLQNFIGMDSDTRLDDNFLFRIHGGKFGLPHRMRNLSSRGTCIRHCYLLRTRNGNRGHHRASLNRDGQLVVGFRRGHVWFISDARRSVHRSKVWRGCRKSTAGTDC